MWFASDELSDQIVDVLGPWQGLTQAHVQAAARWVQSQLTLNASNRGIRHSSFKASGGNTSTSAQSIPSADVPLNTPTVKMESMAGLTFLNVNSHLQRRCLRLLASWHQQSRACSAKMALALLKAKVDREGFMKKCKASKGEDKVLSNWQERWVVSAALLGPRACTGRGSGGGC